MQTVVKAVVIGWVLGCGLGFLVAIAIDRLPFLQRGLLPIASLTSAIPLVGVAPIAVMWFGFEWPSKAAVVVLMTFFPMLVSTLAGLQASKRLERELMHSYAASYTRTLWSLRLPSATALHVRRAQGQCQPGADRRHRGRVLRLADLGPGLSHLDRSDSMNMTLVWAAVVVAAVTGSLAYALLARLERRAAFWHPSMRGRK